MTPLVTVGIPSYNHAPYLAQAIESVLSQTLDDFELVVADDGSHDGSVEIAERYVAAHPDRVKVRTHPGRAHLGIGATGNLAREGMRGRFVTSLPSDDALYPDALEREAGFLESHPEVGFVYGYAHLVDAGGRRLPRASVFGSDVTAGGRAVERLVQGNTIPAMTVMFRRECLLQAGPEHHSLAYSDWEFLTRAAAHWEVGFVPRALAMHRVHPSSSSWGAREANVHRVVEATAALCDRAADVGGRLAEPRVRAALELQLGFYGFVLGDERAAVEHLHSAFDRDPSLAADGRWLGDWLWSRCLDQSLPSGGEPLAPWVARTLTPLLERAAARTFRREAAAATAEERAVRLARAGRPIGAQRAALAAVARSPRRIADRRLARLVLDASRSNGR